MHAQPKKPEPRQARGSRRLKLALAVVVAGATAGTGAGIRALEARDAAIAAATERLRQAEQDIGGLRQENTRLADQMEDLLTEIGTLQDQLDDARAPREIGGPVDFPIQRGMARAGDTLHSFAAREGTTVEVLRALNPWLAPDQSGLKGRQALWIPTGT